MKIRPLRHPASFLLVALTFQLRAQQNLKEIPVPDPDAELKTFRTAPELDVNLFAADPLIRKPIQINFDAGGRLWVASSAIYPQIQPGETANDKIIVLEDTDGDGRADRSVVFADGLLIPTGVAPDDAGGAYVANSTELVHFRDVDGDLKADERHVIFSGFGTEDTHHIVHAFRWGPDGMLYFNQSVYIHSHVETPYGVRRLGGGGIWQFRPETEELEIFLHGMVNGWGHHFDRWGQSFGADGAYSEGVIYFIPGATVVGAPTSRRAIHGLNPGSPKYCGTEILSGRHLPPGWEGSFLTNDFRANRVCRFVLSEDGSGFASREAAEPLRSSSVAFRPVDVKQGPDGAIYVADWYNPIIQHGEVDFRSPLRNHQNGRIWRLVAKGRPLVDRPRLEGAPIPELLDHLKDPEQWTRHHVKRVLSHRPKSEVLSGIAAWVAHLDSRDPEFEHHRLEALWVHQTLNLPNEKLLRSVLNSPEPRARVAATRILRYWLPRLEESLPQLEARIADDFPRVRLEAVRALGNLGTARAMAIALGALDRPVDTFLDYALHLTATELEPQWVAALESSEPVFSGNDRYLEYVLSSVGSARVVPLLRKRVESGKCRGDEEQKLLRLMAAKGGTGDLAVVLDRARAMKSQSLLAALVSAARERGVVPERGTEVLKEWTSNDSNPLRLDALRLAGLWRVEALRPTLEKTAQDGNEALEVQAAAIEGLESLGGEASVRLLSALAAPTRPELSRRQALEALITLEPKIAAQLTVATLTAGSSAAGHILQRFLARKGGVDALIAALKNQKIPEDTAKLALRAARSAPTPPRELVEALSTAGGLQGGAEKELSPEELARLMADARTAGNPGRGEQIFRRKDLSCLKCHAIGGAGGQVGPDLISLGAAAQLDYIIEAVLLPNKAVKENYHSTVAVTKDGQIVTGIKVRESKEEIVLRDADGVDVSLPRGNLEQASPSGSIMPSGLPDMITRDELRDLVRFLSELGRTQEFSLSKTLTARRWRVLENPPPDGLPLSDPRWTPAYSEVSGALPVAELPVTAPASIAYAACELSVTTPGRATLRLNSPDGLTVEIDDVRLEPGREMPVHLTSGSHRVIFRINTSMRKEPLRVELDTVADGARVLFAVGP